MQSKGSSKFSELDGEGLTTVASGVQIQGSVLSFGGDSCSKGTYDESENADRVERKSANA
jgi:hypothetical protein